MDEKTVETTTNEEVKKQSKIPGFRSGTTWKKVVAVIGYIFIGALLIGILTPTDDTSKETKSKKSPLELSQEAYVLGIEYLNSNSYDDAIESFNQVISEDSNYSDAQVKITEIKDGQTNFYLTNAKTNLQNNEYDLALLDIDNALKYSPDSQEVKIIKEGIIEKKREYEEKKKQQEIIDFKNSCKYIEYKVLNKNPDSLIGEKVRLKGHIMQIQEERGMTFMLLSVTNLGYGVWTDNVAVIYDDTANIYKDDVITIWGTVDGSFRYKSVAGWDITVPKVTARYLSK